MNTYLQRALQFGGRAGALIAARDWSAHALGPMERWPMPLQHALGTCLSTTTPTLVSWGRECFKFYNDAFGPMLGRARQHSGMGTRGAELLPEQWSSLQPIFSGLLSGGHAVGRKDILAFLDRDDLNEEAYFDHVHSPIYDDAGQVGGVLTSVTDTTAKVLGERRLSTLNALSRAAEAERNPSTVASTVATQLAAALHHNAADVPFCLLYCRSKDGTLQLAGSAGTAADARPAGFPLERALASMRALICPNSVEPVLSEAYRREGRRAPERAYVLPIPVRSGEAACTVLVTGISPHLRFDAAYRDFLQLAAQLIGRALSGDAGHGGRDELARLRRDVELLTTERDLLQKLEQQTRAAAEAANRVKDEFLAVLGHELRNPLAPITTALALLRQRGPLDREVVIIERQVGHLTRLVEDLLDVSRITRGKLELKRAPVSLASVIDDAVELVSPLLEEQEQNLEVWAPQTGLDVLGDRARLAQVVANLLTNASKYSPRGTRISVNAHCLPQGNTLELSIRDQGIGIEPNMLDTVWNAFTQGAQSLDRSHGGLGIGLTIVQSLVALHGGTVTAHSEGKGLGSEFSVRLPRLMQSSPAPTSHDEPQAQPAAGVFAGRKVLLVDDNEDALELLAEWFRSRDATVETAPDGIAALAAAERFRPEVALLDLGLPALSGYEVARRLRAQPAHQRLVLIAVTGYGERSAREQTTAAGFDEHWVKPLDLSRFEPVLRARLDGTRRTSS